MDTLKNVIYVLSNVDAIKVQSQRLAGQSSSSGLHSRRHPEGVGFEAERDLASSLSPDRPESARQARTLLSDIRAGVFFHSL